MSSIVKSVKKGLSSAASRVKGAVKGDFSDILSVATLGVSDQIKNAGRAVSGALIPEMPDINIPEQPTSAATPGSIGRTTPNVDIGATEQQRRTGGSAKGARKLRIPLGGLR
jgi:hypothetical protein